MGEGEGLDLERQWDRFHGMTPCQLPPAVVWDEQKSLAVTSVRRRAMPFERFVHCMTDP